MSYWADVKGKNTTRLDNYTTIVTSPGGQSPAFYELEAAVVVDVILDENHPYLTKNKISMVPDDHQKDFQGKPSLPTDVDYSYIGRVLVRPLSSYQRVEKEKLVWAIPMESNLSEYPVINEVVVVGKYLGKYFYSRKLNSFNLPNANPDFSLERTYGEAGSTTENGSSQVGNREMYDPVTEYRGPVSSMASEDRPGTQGVSGRYFWVNGNVRSLKRHEGDTIVESRFGQSIRFGAYDEVRDNDVGDKQYPDYCGQDNKNGAGTNSWNGLPVGGGNPMILIRNRQRPLLKEGEKRTIYDKIPPLVGTLQEKNAGGYVLENINYDGSSIHITCGLTISQFKTTCFKSMFQSGMEEQKNYSPSGATNFVYPSDPKGDQIVVNSDRLVLSSRSAETFHFSKKRYAIVTDSEYTVDAHDQIVMNTNNKVVLNSPAIYLGQYDTTDEPVLLGQTSINWLYDLCEWLKDHTHWHKHGHVKDGAGRAVPDKTQFPVEVPQLTVLQSKLPTLLSRRVFVTGGGFAPGSNGGSIPNGRPPTSISVGSGEGVPGGWKAKNNR